MQTQINHIESQFENINTIRQNLIQPKKIQLHSGIDGYDSPDAYGIYRHTGGKPLGVVGKVFEPMDLNFLLDAVLNSLINCGGNEYDLSKLTYTEYRDGSKIVFSIPSDTIEIKTPLKGDVYKTSINFVTGFDGGTKTSINFNSFRLVCSNGMKRWKKDLELAFKNTPGNTGKVAMFCKEIAMMANDIQNYKSNLEVIAKKEISAKELEDYITKATGYSPKQNKEMTSRMRNILDKINQAVAIEQQSTGNTLYSALQGITRYTTHDLAGGSMESVMFGTAERINKQAHELAFAGLN